MNLISELVVVFVALCVVVIPAEWVQIAQTHGEVDQHGLALDQSGILDNIYSRNVLRFEDLEKVIGPGFENDFVNFLRTQDEKATEEPLLAFDGSEFVYEESDKSQEEKPLKTTEGSEEIVVDRSNTRNVRKYFNESSTRSEQKHGALRKQNFNWNALDDKLVLVDQSNKSEGNSQAKKNKIVLKMVKVKTVEQPLSLSTVMNFLKSIQESLVADAAGSIRNKINSLETFKNQLMLNIRERLMALWPTKTERSRRDLWGGHGHSVKFASLEVSLITIAFLTFAVFLIKLVLQTINTIKSKSYSFNGFDIYSNKRPLKTAENLNAKKFSINEENLSDYVKVLSSSESYKYI